MGIATAVMLLFPKLTMKNLSICLILPIASHRQKHLSINVRLIGSCKWKLILKFEFLIRHMIFCAQLLFGKCSQEISWWRFVQCSRKFIALLVQEVEDSSTTIASLPDAVDSFSTSQIKCILLAAFHNWSFYLSYGSVKKKTLNRWRDFQCGSPGTWSLIERILFNWAELKQNLPHWTF